MLAKPTQWIPSSRRTLLTWKATHRRRTEKPVRDSPFVGETAGQPIPARLPNEIIIFNCFHPIFEFVFSTLNVQTV
jgi:hypothetical protein